MSEVQQKVKSVHSDIIGLEPKRKIKFNRRLGIIENGESNNYPTYIERLIRSSVTASQATLTMSKFIRGNGFKTIGKTIVGKDKNKKVSLNKLLKKVAYDLARFRGAFIHVNYNLLGEITELTHVPFKHCRFGQKDSADYSGKVVIYDNWDYTNGNRLLKDKMQVVDIFNPDKEVIQYQIEKAEKISLYKGQVFHLFLDEEYDYPTAQIDVAERDALSEYLMSLFKYNILENDFITDRHIFRHNEMQEPDLKKLKANLLGMKGARGQGKILMIEDNFDEDLPDGQIRIDTISSGVKTGLFESWEQSCSNNIRRCFNNVPQILIDEVEGKLGNSSGEAYKEAQRVYNRLTQEERDEITESFTELLSLFDKTVLNTDGVIIEIEPFNIIDEEETTD